MLAVPRQPTEKPRSRGGVAGGSAAALGVQGASMAHTNAAPTIMAARLRKQHGRRRNVLEVRNVGMLTRMQGVGQNLDGGV